MDFQFEHIKAQHTGIWCLLVQCFLGQCSVWTAWETNSFGAFPITEWKSWSRALWRFNPNISKHNILEFGDKSWSINIAGAGFCVDSFWKTICFGGISKYGVKVFEQSVINITLETCQSTTYCNLVASSEVFVRAVLCGQLFGNKISEADFQIVRGSPWAECYISFFWTYLSITYNKDSLLVYGVASQSWTEIWTDINTSLEACAPFKNSVLGVCHIFHSEERRWEEKN